MAYSLTWLATTLRAAGLKVVEQPGWKERGHGDVGAIKGIICHHTAGARNGNAPSLNVVQNGRSDLAGPLSQLVLGRDGTFYVVAAGLCYHAGGGKWQGITAGNRSFIGIEAENTGLANDQPWPATQMDAYAKGCAAILKKVGAPVIMCCGHSEYALPKGRKNDPTFDMNQFRARVAKQMGQPVPSPVEQPATPTRPPATLPLFEQKASKIVADVMRDFGLKDFQAAGIVGNIGHECGGFKLMQEQNPRSGVGGYGWAQWTGPRRTQFFAWCKAQGLSVDSDAGNYGFLKHELTNTSEKAAIPAVKAATDLHGAMLAFEQKFERAGVKHYDSRLAYSQRALNAYRAAPSGASRAAIGTGASVAAVAGAGAAATVGINQGWGITEWSIAALVIAAICVVGYLVWRRK